ncbi:MAG TPA: amidohydrolase family protein [Polyangia bacterium]|jgi:predicted TIM-barrel fold metal-dependent hydrolase|nr:amidohydrolase family protein [Polyangia bacterium]
MPAPRLACAPPRAAVHVALLAAALAGGACRPRGAAPAATTVADAGASPRVGKRFPRIDTHTHVMPDGIPRAMKLMDEWGIDGMVNLSGMYPGPPRNMLETQLAAAAQTHGRMIVFANADFHLVREHPKDYGKVLAAQLVESKRLGARGLKIYKGLGLGFPAADGTRLLPIDDKGLDPLFEEAGALDMPVAIHVGDPKAFWEPPTPRNERWDELKAHPEWSFYGPEYPPWQALYDAFERRVKRHPKTIFIAVHFGDDPEDPDNVSRMLDTYPNFYIDTAARVPEMGRHDAAKMRAFFEKYQDRILFGTDTGIGATDDAMMFGSNGELPPTRADEERFFKQTWRYFETNDKQFESPTPIQGRWKIDGIGLPDSILRKVYFENAVRVLHWRPQGT